MDPLSTEKLKSLPKPKKISIVLLMALFIFVIAPFCFVLGINLLGFEVPYTFKTLFGAFLVMIVLRKIG